MQQIHTSQLRLAAETLTAGDSILLSGTVYTSRDAAHKRIFSLLAEGKPLPFELHDAAIYYAGPTATPPGKVIGSVGPTTSSRMDPYAPTLYRLGLAATIGKGGRDEQVRRSIMETGGIYLCALGGCGALAAACVTECEVIAFEDLGCESVKKLTIRDFPLIVGIDCRGNTVFADSKKNEQV